jgi:hypothetical protein
MESTSQTGTVGLNQEYIRRGELANSQTTDRPLIFTHSGRWRFTQVIMISIFGQFSGNGLGYFNTVIFKNLGVTETSQQLGYNILTSVLSAIGALTAVSLTDTMPRRPVLVFGTLGAYYTSTAAYMCSLRKSSS